MTRLTPDGSAVVYSTFLGGGGGEGAASIDVDVMGCAYIAGTVTGQDFPTTPGAYSERNLGGSDAFVAKLSADGTSLVYCTFIGGKDSDAAVGVAVDSYGAAHVVGCTYSTDFPVTAGALGTGHGSGWDVFLAKLADDGTELRFATAIGGLGHDRGCAIAMGTPGTVFVAGHTSSEEFVATDGAYCRSHRGGAYDAFLLCLKWVPTSIFTIGRVGTITELTILRGYLSRTSDAGKLDGRTVEFRIDGTAVGSAVTGTTGASGRADLNWTISDGPPLRTITAQFAGDHAYLPSSATATLTAQAWGTKMVGFDRTARIGGKTELKARLLRSDNVPLYNKLIDFSVDGTFVIARPTDTPGYARYPYYTVPDGAGAGTRTILAEWQGNAGYMASSASTTLNVLRATPYIWVMPRSVPQGGVARLYAYFRRLADYQKQEGKTVTFRIDGTWVADVVTLSGAEAGIARYQYTTIEPPGAHTIRCEFAGDAWVDAGYGE
ncbi:MAG: Ig-like domain repeat protein [Armatimonadetes bacterium]|nr:Ig-like domain repeat protein [Armatimonadota bacterium]